MINLLSYNVNGFQAFSKRRDFVQHFLFSQTNTNLPHIVALQETHSHPQGVGTWADQLYSNVLYSHADGQSGGVLLAFRTTIPHTINSYVSDNKGRYLVAHVTIVGEELTIVNAYLRPQMVKDEFCKV